MKMLVNTLEEWRLVARALCADLTPGTVLLLSGPLGAGKTTLTQAIAAELGIPDRLKSPTFALLRTYTIPNHPTLRSLTHIDAYRLESADEVLSLGLDEALETTAGVFIIEWPEKMQDWLEKTHAKKREVTIEIKERDQREVTIRTE